MIITGALHALNPSAPTLAGNDFYSSTDDPKFAGSGLDPGYLTTRPGTREPLFYDRLPLTPRWSPWTKRTRTPSPPPSSTGWWRYWPSRLPSNLPTRTPCRFW